MSRNNSIKARKNFLYRKQIIESNFKIRTIDSAYIRSFF
ncbi:hypothetical protein LEP1GSC191_1326 [Leptospira borgpetersenii serovar Mini str. 201000851]|uniref:Uncharacterized protein n=2 Tax=Leptospira borgpetersenii TaxID=174 RepID=M3FCX7_LEPBO|nr:hypothetical protein LEP1GSC128_1565 [Leptospira borgpetersenii str. 200801926]EMF99712.1 hypothetical protein LEP1GSC123_2644 [Leptospira borgpetersenii str. 200701203]ENO64220.1 hypothetical protein LEP1GSC191_1326 [Leptospira borgpetersenii serovar Mini str. 201000851]